jgi:hypothetical protein
MKVKRWTYRVLRGCKAAVALSCQLAVVSSAGCGSLTNCRLFAYFYWLQTPSQPVKSCICFSNFWLSILFHVCSSSLLLWRHEQERL